MLESKHGSNELVLPPQTVRMAEYESGLRWHWPLQDALTHAGLITEVLNLGIGMKSRHPDPDFTFLTFLAHTEAEVAHWTGDQFRAAISAAARKKSSYNNPAEGPKDTRQALCDRYARRFGVPNIGIERVLGQAGGCSQALDVVVMNLAPLSGIALVDTPCWPGTPPKLVRHGLEPVSMYECHESFDANRKYIAPFIDRGIGLVYVAFPGNPKGLALTPERLEVLARTRLWLRDRCLDANKPAPFWISDGVYMDQPAKTLSMLAGQDPGDVVEIFSLTKGRLTAGKRDSWIVVGDSKPLLDFVAAQARDGLSPDVSWNLPLAQARAIRDANGFLARERELDVAASAAFVAVIDGVDGLSIDPACDDQYRYVNVQIPEEAHATTEDMKRWHMLECAANGTPFADWIPGPYFNHPLLLRASGVRIHEVDGIRCIMAFPPDVMTKAAHVIVRTWQTWKAEGFTKVPDWDDLVVLVQYGITPQQILDASRNGSINAILDRVKTPSVPDNGGGDVTKSDQALPA